MAEGDIFLFDAELVAPASGRVFGLLRHLYVEPESDALLESLVTALCTPLEPLAEIAFGDDTGGPWRALTDPGIAGLDQLAHAAQWTGGRLPPRLSGEDSADYLVRARLELIYPRGLRRSSSRAAEIVADPFLSGTKHFELDVDIDDPRIVYVDIIASEVADKPGLLAALNGPDVAAAGQRFEYVPDVMTWNQIATGHSWDAVTPALTWQDTTHTAP